MTLLSHSVLFMQGLILTPLVIKTSGAEVYGEYVLWISILGVIFGISSLGIGIHFKRYAPSSTEFNKISLLFFRQFNFQLLSIVFLSILAVVCYYIKFSGENFNFVYLWLIPFYLLSYFLYSQTTDYYRYNHSYNIYNIIGVVQPIIFISLILAYSFFYQNLSSYFLILGQSIVYSLLGGLLLSRIINKIGVIYKIPNFKDFISESKIGSPLVLSFILDISLMGSDKYIIAILLSVKEVGYYVPAFSLGVIPMVFSRVIGVILPPILAKSVDNNDISYGKKILEGVSRIFIYFVCPYIVGGLVFGKEILSFYTTNEISENAWKVIPTMSLATLFYGLMSIKMNILFILLKTRDVFFYNLVGAFLGILFNIVLLLIYRNIFYSSVSALFTYFICYYMISYKINQYPLRFNININSWIIPISASILMGTILFILKKYYYNNEIFNLVFLVACGVFIYSLILISFKCSREDVAKIYNLFN